jgi:hypothetical protein
MNKKKKDKDIRGLLFSKFYGYKYNVLKRKLNSASPHYLTCKEVLGKEAQNGFLVMEQD